jgi:hypothetical protein
MTDKTDVTIRPFGDWLAEQAKGKTHAELGEGLHDLIARVQDTGKKGSITLTVTVEPMKQDGTLLVVSDEIKLKLPEYDRPSGVFYADKNGNLTRDNPDQMTFESLREVPPPPGVNTSTGEVTTTHSLKGA